MAYLGNPVTLTGNVASKTISATATASQTTFAITGGYRINQIAVYRNGVRLVDGSDYTARDGATVIITSPALSGDSFEFQIFDDFRVADALDVNSGGTINGNVHINGSLSINGSGPLGIQSAGTTVGTGITQLNFVGTGNTFSVNGNTVDISISGSGGGGGFGAQTVENTNNIFGYVVGVSTITQNITFDQSNSGVGTSYVITAIPTVEIASGVAVTVGSGKTMIIDILNLGAL